MSTPAAATGVKAKNSNGGVHKSATANYSKVELISLVTIIRDRAPNSSEEFKQIALLHNINYPCWNVKSMKDKYGKLQKLKAPTRNPNIPKEVRLAKEVFRAIWGSADLSTGEDNFTIEHGRSLDPGGPVDELKIKNCSYKIVVG